MTSTMKAAEPAQKIKKSSAEEPRLLTPLFVFFMTSVGWMIAIAFIMRPFMELPPSEEAYYQYIVQPT